RTVLRALFTPWRLTRFDTTVSKLPRSWPLPVSTDTVTVIGLDWTVSPSRLMSSGLSWRVIRVGPAVAGGGLPTTPPTVDAKLDPATNAPPANPLPKVANVVVTAPPTASNTRTGKAPPGPAAARTSGLPNAPAANAATRTPPVNDGSK